MPGRMIVPKIAGCYTQGKIEIDPMIPDTPSPDAIDTGCDRIHAGKRLRPVVLY